MVTDDGFFVRIKPFIVTRSSVKASQKSETRSVARDVVLKFCAQSTWIKVQKALMDGSLEESVSTAISKIQPVRAVFFRRSQLIQEGVVVDDGIVSGFVVVYVAVVCRISVAMVVVNVLLY